MGGAKGVGGAREASREWEGLGRPQGSGRG